MNFLLVLGEEDVMWLGDAMEALKAEVVVKNSPDDAAAFIRSKDFSADEIITGTFAQGDLNGPWRLVWEAAKERGLGVTLFSSMPWDDNLIQELASEGVKYLGKMDFDQAQFITERSGGTRPPELG